MKPAFVAGFGPIVKDTDASRAFWGEGMGIGLAESSPGYWTNDDLEGVKAFALWPLSQAAAACFGTETWPPDLTEPHAWLELDVDTPDDVAPATAEMAGRGYRILVDAKLEPWGQTVSHLMSPEGILVGIVYTPWMHKTGDEAGEE
jgi:catechol 2,3-dioxygenase-like lactoylglutathione lyase family enzyme